MTSPWLDMAKLVCISLFLVLFLPEAKMTKIAARLHGIGGKLEFLGPLFVIREVVSAEVHPA